MIYTGRKIKIKMTFLLSGRQSSDWKAKYDESYDSNLNMAKILSCKIFSNC